MSGERRIPAATLVRLVETLLERAGTNAKNARACAEHLVGANLRGHDSHGVGMLPSYLAWIAAGRLHPNATAEIVHDAGAVVVVDGRFGLGQAIAAQAMDIGIARARRFGLCALALRNSCHIGRIGAWGEMGAAAGLVSIHFVNVVGHGPLVAPFGGREARMVTNPFCCAIPRPGGEPLVLDFATSLVAAGKLRVARLKGEPAPEGSLMGRDGRPTRDPDSLFTGEAVMLPFGAHKGGGLQIACEILGGALAGLWTQQPGSDRAYGASVNNMLCLLLDPASFGDAAAFAAEAEAMLAYIAATPPAEGVGKVLLPGEPEREAMAARLAEGIPLDSGTWAELLAAAARLGLDELAVDALAPSA